MKKINDSATVPCRLLGLIFVALAQNQPCVGVLVHADDLFSTIAIFDHSLTLLKFEGVPGDLLEHFLDVEVRQGRRLELCLGQTHLNPVLLNPRWRYHLPQVQLVPHQHEWNALRLRRIVKILAPHFDVAVALLIVRVVADDAAVRAPIKTRAQRLEALLSRGVPQGQIDFRAVGQLNLPLHEVRADRRLGCF